MCKKSPFIRKQSIVVMFFAALLFFMGHYYVYALPIDIAREICVVSSSALLGLCIFGVIFLLSDSRGIRSQRIFALQLLLIGLAAAFSVTRIIIQHNVVAAPLRLYSPWVLVYGNVYAFIMLMYPLELLSIGRMTFVKYFKIFLPVLLTGLFYYGYIRLTGHQMTYVDSWSDLLANFYKFDVWFRLTLVVYPIGMFFMIMYQKKRYISWCCKNYSAEGYINLGWLDYYLFGYFLILISYLIVISIPNTQSMLIHSLCFLILLGYSLFNILRQEVPVLSKLCEENDLDEGLETESTSDLSQPYCNEREVANDKYRFEDKIPEYKLMLEHWMQREKPYLNQNFKLLDVMQVLPLNRSYLSRIFNEVYGETFFCFIMRYRIKESIQVMETNPKLTVTQIAKICGFSSASVFGRAFLKNMGMTPKEYRDKQKRTNLVDV